MTLSDYVHAKFSFWLSIGLGALQSQIVVLCQMDSISFLVTYLNAVDFFLAALVLS